MMLSIVAQWLVPGSHTVTVTTIRLNPASGVRSVSGTTLMAVTSRAGAVRYAAILITQAAQRAKAEGDLETSPAIVN